MEDARESPRNRSGFTLVELVVVIAILGILAGVAYAGYGGYLEYAKRSGDEDLIAAANAAFAAACEEEGVDRSNLFYNDVVLYCSDGGTKIRDIYSIKGVGVYQKGFDNTFLKYFGENINTPLKYYKKPDIKFIDGNYLFSADKKLLSEALSQKIKGSNLASDSSQLKQALKQAGIVAKKVLDKLLDVQGDKRQSILGIVSGVIGNLESEGYDFGDIDINNVSPEQRQKIADALIHSTALKFSDLTTDDVIDQFNEMGKYSDYYDTNIKDREAFRQTLGEMIVGSRKDVALAAGIAASYSNYLEKNNITDTNFTDMYNIFLKSDSGSDKLSALMTSASRIQSKHDEGFSLESELSAVLATFSSVDKNSKDKTFDEQIDALFEQLGLDDDNQ